MSTVMDASTVNDVTVTVAVRATRAEEVEILESIYEFGRDIGFKPFYDKANDFEGGEFRTFARSLLRNDAGRLAAFRHDHGTGNVYSQQAEAVHSATATDSRPSRFSVHSPASGPTLQRSPTVSRRNTTIPASSSPTSQLTISPDESPATTTTTATLSSALRTPDVPDRTSGGRPSTGCTRPISSTSLLPFPTGGVTASANGFAAGSTVPS